MTVEFHTIAGQSPGIVARMLRQSYSPLLESDPAWRSEEAAWDHYDSSVFDNPTTIGACFFLTYADGLVAGFASWDPRQAPQYGIIGHNCILPQFRRNGLGILQIKEVLRRFKSLGIRTARVTTNDHPFFIPAQRTYTACGFKEVRRIPCERAPSITLINYEKRMLS